MANTPVSTLQGGTGLSTTYTNGQLLIGNSGSGGFNASTLTGTTHQVNISNGGGSITLSTPQNIDSTATPTFADLTLTNNTSAISGINAVLNFGSSLTSGTYLNLGSTGNNIGLFNEGAGVYAPFMSFNLDYDATLGTYKYHASSKNGFALELDPTAISLKYVNGSSGIAGNPVTLTTGMSLNANGILNLPLSNVTPSTFLALDGSYNVISGTLIGFTSIQVISSGASFTLSNNVLYFNSYAGGQLGVLLPNAPPNGTMCGLIGLYGASASGWKINSQGSDRIQLASQQGLAGSAGGGIESTAGSATDGVWLIYISSILTWVSIQAIGADLIVN